MHADNEPWSKFAEIREAEFYVKSKEIKKAGKILEVYEDYCEIGLQTTARQAILYRINAERYLEIDDIKNALRNFKTAVIIGNREGYEHELDKLEWLFFKFKILRDNLPETFAIRLPIWS